MGGKKLDDITGNRYGKLLVIGFVKMRDNGHSVWKCQCDCGNVTETLGCRLKNGSCKSCGCLNKEVRLPKIVTHKMSYTRLYGIWHKMKYRSFSTKWAGADRYANRGIGMCEEWNRFEPFRDWALANGYDDTLSIDRIDNDKGYYPENCRWTTPKEQARNRSDNVFIEYNGEKKTIAEWAEVKGLTYAALHCRLNKYHWTIADALERPLRKHK